MPKETDLPPGNEKLRSYLEEVDPVRTTDISSLNSRTIPQRIRNRVVDFFQTKREPLTRAEFIAFEIKQ